MAITEYVRLLRRAWWFIVLLAVVGGVAAAAAVAVLQPPRYESCARLFVSTEGGTAVGDAYQNSLFSQERIASYAGLATTRQVAQRAIDALGIDRSASALADHVTATAVPDSVLLDVCVDDRGAQTARRLAAAVSEQLVRVVAVLETPERGGSPAAGARIIDEASRPGAASGIGPTRAGVAGALAGLALGLLVAILRGLLGRRVEAREELEKLGATSVVVSFPRVRGNESLAGDHAASAPVAELATFLRFAPDRPRSISVTSPAADDGRTSVALDLAAQLALMGLEVAVVDAHLGAGAGTGSLSERVDLLDADGVAEVTAGTTDLMDSLHAVRHAGAGFDVLPAGHASSSTAVVGTDRFGEIVRTLAEQYRFVLIDTAPLSEGTDAALVSAWSDSSVLIARRHRTRSVAVRRAAGLLRSVGVPVAAAVLTFDGTTRVRRDQDDSAPDPSPSEPSPVRPTRRGTRSTRSRS